MKGGSVSGDVTLSSPYARLSHFRLHSGTSGIGALPFGALSFGAKFKLALGPRFYPRSEFGRIRTQSTRTDLRAAIGYHTLVNLYFSFSFSFSSCETRRTRCAYESRSAAPLLKEPRMRHERSQNICYGHEERKVTAGITQARRARYLSCLLGIVTFLAERGNKEGSLGAAPPPRIAHHLGRTFTITRNGVGTDRGGGRSKSAFLEFFFFFFTSPRRALLTLKPLPKTKRGLLSIRVALDKTRSRQLSSYTLIEEKSPFTSNVPFYIS